MTVLELNSVCIEHSKVSVLHSTVQVSSVFRLLSADAPPYLDNGRSVGIYFHAAQT